MNHPQQINPARSTPQETALERWDRSQRGRRFKDLDEKRRHGALSPLQRDTFRVLAAERRAIIRELSAVSDRVAGANVRRMPGGKP
jgi:hypothetical protein